MRRSFPILAALAALACSIRAAPAGPVRTEIYPRVFEVSFPSGVLPGRHHYCVVEPRQPGPWPVFFLLHGRGRTHRSLVDIEAVRHELQAMRFCTVLPQGDDGWYIDSPVRPQERYERYLQEVMAVAGVMEPISQDPMHRAIGGWSMGGYGAMRFATRHRDAFHAVATVIGLIDFPRSPDLPPGRNYRVPVARFGSDPAVWRRYNPYFSAEALRGMDVLLVTASDSFDRVMNERFHNRLNELGIAHDFVVLPGAHKLDVVENALHTVLPFVTRSIAR